MNLSPYVEHVRAGLTSAAALADDHTRHVAGQLGSAVDAATRLALISALSDAAAEISAELAPGSVELRMAGSDPEFHVTLPAGNDEPTWLSPRREDPPRPEEEADPEDEPMARVSLRLPASVKAKVDALAAQDGISTNAWLIRAVSEAIVERGRPGPPPPPPPFGGGVFGPHGPFGPHGVFGQSGLFGGARPAGHHEDREPGGRERRGAWADRRPGGVQGWAR